MWVDHLWLYWYLLAVHDWLTVLVVHLLASLGSGGHNDLLLLLVRPFRSHTAANSDDDGDDDDNKWNDDRNNDDGNGNAGRDVFDCTIAAILIAIVR